MLNLKHTGILLSVLMSLNFISKAQNPIIQTKFTADPAPLVYNDTVFLYTGHDEDDAFGFKMRNWLLYTSTDMVNWTDHGIVASLNDFKWAPHDNGAWAPQCVSRNGKFYLYCPVPNGQGIGVLVSESPYGPFKDPIGKPLIKHSKEDIDPTVLIDDDGQAYLYWGNPNLYYVKLNEDMISFSGEVIKDTSMAKVKGQNDPFHYQEGPWAYKFNNHYYMFYASTCCPEGIGYAMSDRPTGAWRYKGMVMDGSVKSNGNHPGVIDYKGNTYLFGFNYDLLKQTMSKHYERRSVCVAKLKFNADGSIPKLPFWSEVDVEPIGTINPFRKVEAETIAYSKGVQTAVATEWERNVSWDRGKMIETRRFVCSINNGDFTKVRNVDFADGAASVSVSIASLNGGSVEIHVDSIDGPILATLNIESHGQGDLWKTLTEPISKISGIHDVFFVFKGNNTLFNFDWWRINK